MIDTPPAQVDLKTDMGSGIENEQPAIASARPRIWRALILGAVLVPLNVVWTTAVEVRWNTLDGTSLPLFITPVFLLLMAVLLSIMRSRFYWWPLHPAGYALAFSYAMDYFWMPMFVAWLIKSLILRWGGSRVYRDASPFFLGLILGDYTIGAIWALIGPLLGVETYRIYL